VRAGRSERRLFDGLLFGIAVVSGLVIVFLWFISLHTVTHWNLHLLWAWPTHLIAAWALGRPTPPRWLHGYLAATAFASLGVAVAWFFLPQAMPAALLPLVLVLAARSAMRVFVREPGKKSKGPASRALVED